jgi:hypothetical protein
MSRNKIKRSPPPPAAPTNIPTKSNIANDIASNVVSGFAFGAGSSMARHAVDSMFQPKSELKPKQESESSLHSEYLECLKHNHEDTCKAFFSQM